MKRIPGERFIIIFYNIRSVAKRITRTVFFPIVRVIVVQAGGLTQARILATSGHIPLVSKRNRWRVKIEANECESTNSIQEGKDKKKHLLLLLQLLVVVLLLFLFGGTRMKKLFVEKWLNQN